MELLLINRNKLKVILTAQDMAAYALTCENIDYDNTETRRAFWDIFDTAKHKTGFDAASDRIFIQVYPHKSGGCELFVTKLIKNSLSGPEKETYASDNTVSMMVKSLGDTGKMKTEVHELYCFEKLENLLEACHKLHLSGFTGGSAAYAGNENENVRYYLIITLPSSEYSSQDFMFLNEYGVRKTNDLNNMYLYSYITEHCRCICVAEAVGVLAGLK